MNEDFSFSRRNIGLKRRYWAERRFRAYGLIAIFYWSLFFICTFMVCHQSRVYSFFSN